jgi:hypothetical protein
LILLAFTMLLLVGCLRDPGGMTTRQQIRSSAAIEVARQQAEAEKAHAAALEHAATQQTIQAGIMWAVLPWIVLIIMGGAVAGITVWWQGKIWHTRTLMVGHTRPPTALPGPGLAELKALAARNGYHIELDGHVLYLMDDRGHVVGQRQLMEG